MAHALSTSHVSSGDRLGFMIFLMLVVHALVIFGIHFDTIDISPPSPAKQLEITLAPIVKNMNKPEEADFLAQSAQEGGGSSETPIRPDKPGSPVPEIAQSGPSMVTVIESGSPSRKQKKISEKVITQEESPDKIKITEEPEADPAPINTEKLIQRSLAMAQQATPSSNTTIFEARRTKHRFISARTHEIRDAAYLDAWRQKVERIGNLNYPEAAKRKRLSGSLLLDVAILPDGSVEKITIRRSSGKKLLDDAAIRIVKLAAPFSPFPPQMRKDTDVLHIIRTWQFLANNQLISR